jgi:putative membrane protein
MLYEREDALKSKVRMKAKRTLVFTVLASAMVLDKAFAHQRGDYGGWGMGSGMMWGWGMGWFGMIFMIVFWILMIVGLVFLIRWLIQTTKGGKDVIPGSSNALEILRERYARGEVNKGEFEQMKKDILG